MDISLILFLLNKPLFQTTLQREQVDWQIWLCLDTAAIEHVFILLHFLNKSLKYYKKDTISTSNITIFRVCLTP